MFPGDQTRERRVYFTLYFIKVRFKQCIRFGK
jgi:hypothetical protein